MDNFKFDKGTGEATTSITAKMNEKKIQEIDVKRLAINTFKLPHGERSVFSITKDEVSTVIARATIEPTEVVPLKVANTKPHYKMLVHIIHHCLLGLLGSKDQISAAQKQIMTAMVSDETWDWASAFVRFLHADHMAAHSKKSNTYRTELKISAMILKATPNTVWPDAAEIPKNVLYFEQAAKGGVKKMLKSSSDTEPKEIEPKPKKKKTTVQKAVPELSSAKPEQAEPSQFATSQVPQLSAEVILPITTADKSSTEKRPTLSSAQNPFSFPHSKNRTRSPPPA